MICTSEGGMLCSAWCDYRQDMYRGGHCLAERRILPKDLIIIIIIYPLTARVVEAPQLISQPVSSTFLCSALPCGTRRNPGLSIPWCCLPTSSSPFHFALQDGFCQTGWTGDMSIHCSLRLFTMVTRSSCSPIACWILTRSSSLVTRSLCEMHSILRKHLISMACILLWSSAVRVHDSQTYRKMDVTRNI